MVKSLTIFGWFCFSLAQVASPQEPPPLLHSTSAFVEVPAFVSSRSGEPITSLSASQFRIFDNGVAQIPVMEKVDNLPVALLVLVQTGGTASQQFSSYAALPMLLRQFVGRSEHERMLVTFDSHLEQIWHFPQRADGVLYALTHLQAGDRGAAIRDAVSFGVRQLQSEPGRFRRVVLLISQPNDAGSKTTEQDLLQQLGTAGTVVYNLQFPAPSPHQKKTKRTARRKIPTQPDDLQSALDAIKANTGAEIAALTGGDSETFTDQRSFNSHLLSIGAAFRSAYQLGFQPSGHTNGFHSIKVSLKTPANHASITARTAYWVDTGMP